jgi:Tfp pilus assembly protein PilF
MVEPTTLIYALVGAAGLLGAEAYYNSSTVHIETSVAPIYEQMGYNQKVVQAIFAGNLETIANTDSVTGQLEFVTDNHKPVGSALAEAAGLSSSFEAAKAAAGIEHTMVLASVVVDTKDGKSSPRIVVAGNTNGNSHFNLTVPLTETTPVDLALAEAAFRTMERINPYLAALYAFGRAEKNGVHPVEAERIVEEWIDNAPTNVYSPERALFENLRGLSFLIDGDPASAEVWFQKSNKSDPEFGSATINLAFIALCKGYFVRAAELLEPFAQESLWPSSVDDRILYAAHVGLGVAFSRLGKFEESDSQFADAMKLKPDGVSVYFYWARSLLKQNRTAEAKSLVETSQRNAKQIVNLPELASLYFWLPEEPNGRLERRTKELPKMLTELIIP